MLYCMTVAFFLLSWFDISLFTTQINMTLNKCNALSIMSCMIAFYKVHAIRLYLHWEVGILSKKISSSLCNQFEDRCVKQDPLIRDSCKNLIIESWS